MVEDIVLPLCRRVGLDIEHFTELNCLASTALEVSINQDQCPVCVVCLAIVCERVRLAGREGVDSPNDGLGPSVSGPIEIHRGVILVHNFESISVPVEVGVVELEEAVCNRFGVHFLFLILFCMVKRVSALC